MSHTSDNTTKRCKKCGESFPATAEYFHRNKSTKSGLTELCKDCESKRRGYKKRIPRVPDGLRRCSICKQIFPASRDYFTYSKHDTRYGLSHNCRECAKRLAIEWCKNHPEESLEIRNRNNRSSKTRERNRQRYWEDPETYRERRRQRRLKPGVKEHEREYNAAWQQRNKSKVVEASRKRRSRKSGLTDEFTTKDWEFCLSYWNFRCAICGRPQGLWHCLAQEHWIPIIDSRPDNPGTVLWNIIPMCHGIDGCNNSKSTKDPIEWLIYRLGKRAAKKKLKEIEAYFNLVRTRTCE